MEPTEESYDDEISRLFKNLQEREDRQAEKEAARQEVVQEAWDELHRLVLVEMDEQVMKEVEQILKDGE